MKLKQMAALSLAVLLVASLFGGVTVTADEVNYTLGEEVLLGGDFESNTERWMAEGTPGEKWIKDGVGKDGSAGMQLVKADANSEGDIVQFYQGTIDVVPGNCYVLSFDFLANPNNTFVVNSSSLGVGKATKKLTDKNADGTWQTYTKQFVVPASYKAKENRGIGVYLQKLNADAPVVIDNLSLRECTMNQKVESVKLDYNEIYLLKGNTQSLKALVDPVKSDVNNTVWTTSDAAVATVENGKVTAVGGGTATITVKMNNGLTDTCTVTVVDKEATEADLTVTNLTWEGGDGQVKPGTRLTFTATVKNVGTADVTDPFYVDFSAGLDRIFRITYEGGVKAGEEVQITTKKWRAKAGDHMMAVRVNPTLTVAESNDRTNNSYQINLRVAKDRLAPAYNADLVAQAGMHNLTFNDDFDSLDTIDKAASGKEGYKWYVTRPYGASTLTPDDYSAKDGILYLHNEVSTYNYGLSTVDIPTWNGYTFHKGYLEFRVRMPHYDSSLSGGPAIWSMPENKLHNKDVEMWIEVDWMEYWGITKARPEGYYTITLHEQWVDETVTVTDWYNNGKTHSQGGFGDAEWHTMGFLWEEGCLQAFFDGELVLTQKWADGEVPDPPATHKQGEYRFEDIFTYMDEQVIPFFINGSKDNPMEIDYIRVWQYGDAYTGDNGVPAGVIWGAVSGAVVVVAVVLWLVLRKRKATAEVTETEE